MGRALVACAGACDIEVVGVIASAHSPAVGQDAGEMAGVHRLGVAVTTDLGAALRAAQVVIDFSLPHFARDHVEMIRTQGVERVQVLELTGVDRHGCTRAA